MQRTLVLGGGGVTGIAWELGVLEGLRREGVDLGDADVVIGTSAGAVAGALMRTAGIEAGYRTQTEEPVDEIPARLSPLTLLRLGGMLARRGDPATIWRRVGEAASAAQPGDGAERLRVIRRRIGEADWPRETLRITAVDVDDGEFVVFDADSGVSLVDAVAASCAIPLIWPPIRIGRRRHVDGGIRSPANVDLAEGADRVVVLAPTTQAVRREHRIARQLERVGADRRIAISPDPDADRAIGKNPLDPARRVEAAAAGLAQGRRIAAAVAEVWG